MREVGIFDTLGYFTYTHAGEIADHLKRITDVAPLSVTQFAPTKTSPVYILLPKIKTDFEIRILARIKKARLQFRSFDPEEQGRLSAREAIQSVASAWGVIVPLVASIRNDALVHNLRAAFVAGLASGLQKQLLLFQDGDGPVPLDYRDLVTWIGTYSQLDGPIGEFASEITDLLQSGTRPNVARSRNFLSSLNLGASAAENEMRELGEYYLQTDEYHRALRGEAQIIAGRKGSGKTALFVQLRDTLRRNKQTIVLDLKPEGFQLLKFKDVILDRLHLGTKDHTITAFWEYLLLLETCYKILEKDRDAHIRNHHLYEPYRELAREYQGDDFVTEGDFAERILKLTNRIAEDFEVAVHADDGKQTLTHDRLTGLLYKHDTARLRHRICSYLKFKTGLWVLFDNLDKGWPAHGLTADDLTMLRCLLDAIAKLERYLRHHDHEVECHGMVFIRNDVYEMLIENTSDRGKITRITVDWSDTELLRELLRRRFVASGASATSNFDDIWGQLCVSHIDGFESSSYLIDRCLMRPRALIDLIQCCRSHAVNLNHSRIEVDDIKQGEEAFSTDLVVNIGFEIRDVYPDIRDDILYEFIGCSPRLKASKIESILGENGKLEPAQVAKVIDLLLWNGFLGIVRSEDDVTYIYSVRYERKRLKAFVNRPSGDEPLYQINPAFWAGLDIQG
jgi:hypothetical protein